MRRRRASNHGHDGQRSSRQRRWSRRRRSSRAHAQPAAQPSFRTGVELVSLNVTVTEGASRYVTDLEQKDFQVFEDGVKQDVTFFNRTNLPIALSLLIDTSASMESRLRTAQEAAIGFARKLRPQDLAEVVDFDSRVIILQAFTNNAASSSRRSAGRRPAARRRCTTRSTSP